MNTDSLALFVALYQQRSIAKAASHAFMTPQGANRALRALESELGASLFDRTSSGLKPTEAGERFYTFAEQGLREFAWLQEDIARIVAHPGPNVRIGLEPDLLSAIGVEVFDSFSQIHTDVSLQMQEMSESQLTERLASGGLDCALAVLPLNDNRFEEHHLASEQTYVVARETLLPTVPVSIPIEDLASMPFVLVDQSFKARRRFDEQCRASGFEPHVVFSSNDKSLTYSAVRSGKAATVVAEHERRQIDLTGLVAIPIQGDTWSFGLVLPHGKTPPPHVAAFVRHMEAASVQARHL